MRVLLSFLIVLCAGFVCSAPARARVEVEHLPLTHAELHELETQARMAHPHTSLMARDLHPATPIMLAELDDSIPAFIVEREVVLNMAELDDDVDMSVSAEPEMENDDATAVETAEATEDDDDAALIESEFEISQPYGGYGGLGYGGGYGGGKKRSPLQEGSLQKSSVQEGSHQKRSTQEKTPAQKEAPTQKKIPN